MNPNSSKLIVILITTQALLDSVGTSVESAVAEEIDGLPEMVDDFDHVFYDDPIIRFFTTISLLCYDENSQKVPKMNSNFTRDVYRDQLVTFVETGLNKNLQSRLSPSICGRVEAKQHDIISRLVKEYH